MKNKLFKKALAVLLVFTMIFAMAGCGSNNTEDTAEKTTEAVEETSEDTTEETSDDITEETSEEASSDSVKGALEGVTLTFGTSGLFAPFSYYDDNGELIGFDVDFCNALSDYLGFKVDGEMQAMDYSALTTSLAEGKLDFGMAALCATDERKEVMNFSETYCDSGQVMAINTETSPSELTSVDMLTSGDYKVAVEKGTASHLYLQKAGVPDSALEVHDEITTAYESLEQGKVDCLLQDAPGMAYYIKTVEGTKLQIVGEEFNQGQAPYAIAFSFDCCDKNENIVEIFNQAVNELIENGTFDELSAKWLQ